jgi:hypothetical protein
VQIGGVDGSERSERRLDEPRDEDQRVDGKRALRAGETQVPFRQWPTAVAGGWKGAFRAAGEALTRSGQAVSVMSYPVKPTLHSPTTRIEEVW